MSLPGDVKAFWYAAIDLGAHARRTPWGAVGTDHRYPLVWDANTAAVMEPAPTLTVEAVREALMPSLAAARAPYEHIEFWEPAENPALSHLRPTGEHRDPDVVMVFTGGSGWEAPVSVRVHQMERPRASFWSWYRDSLREFGMSLSEDALDQMVRRARDVFHPAGMRWFVGQVDGTDAGYASLLSLDGVGYVADVVTMPGFRRKGVATAAVTRAVRASLDSGDRTVFLLTELDGQPQRLYERLGFRVAGPIESFTRLLTAEDAR